MNSSFSRVKKFLTPPLTNSTTSLSTISPKTLTQTKNTPILPQLIFQNQDLKQQLSILQKQKQYLQNSIQSHNPYHNHQNKRYSFNQQSPRIYKSLQKQNNHNQFTNNFVKWWKKHTQSPKSQNPQNHKTQTQTQNNKITQLTQNLKQQKQKTQKLQQKIQNLNKTIQYHENDKAQLHKIIQELSNKLQQSTNYINQIKNPPNFQHYQNYLQQLTQQIKIKQNQNLILLTQTTQQKPQQILQQKTQQNTQLIHQLISLKQSNYQLRNNINQLIINNNYLKSKTITYTTAITHLWQIKNIQFQNMKMCLADIQGLSTM